MRNRNTTRLWIVPLVVAATFHALPMTYAADVKEEDKSFAALAGAATKSDHTAKHFSLVFGAIAQSPFKFKKEPTPEATKSEQEATATPAPVKFQLETGDTEVKAFIEGGFRYRWAWLDRGPAIPDELEGIAEALDDECVPAGGVAVAAPEGGRWWPEWQTRHGALDEAKAEVEKGKKELKAINDQLTAATDSSVRAFWHSRWEAKDKQMAIARATLEKEQEKYDALEDAARVALHEHCPEDAPLSMRVRGTTVDWQFPSWERLSQEMAESRGTYLFSLALPEDWDLRMGYVFDGSKEASASTIAGSDFYAHLGIGWQIGNFVLATADPNDVPIRGSLDLEATVDASSDTEFADVHERVMLGPSFVFGVPFTMIGQEKSDDEDSDVQIMELIVRGGVVFTEVPDYIDDDSRYVEVENESPTFGNQIGAGLDVEMNVPITETLGYIFARGGLDLGFDPNPWTVQVGYTLPIGSLLQGLTGKSPSDKK